MEAARERVLALRGGWRVMKHRWRPGGAQRDGVCDFCGIRRRAVVGERGGELLEFSTDGKDWTPYQSHVPWPPCAEVPASMTWPGQPIFSDEDADLRRRMWNVCPGGYAITRVPHLSKFKKTDRDGWTCSRAHRVVMSRVLGRDLLPGEIVDHINWNTLDCRRENLRLTDRVGSAQHRRIRKDSRTGVKCVKRVRDKWVAFVCQQGRKRHLGTFSTLEEAGAVAARARRELGFLGSNDNERTTQ
jgi:hypothetical protein